MVFTATDVLVPGAPAPVSFSARRGEILGFAGLIGAGRTELMQTIFGVTPALGGDMTLGGKPFAPATPRDAIDAGVFLVPEDRKRHGLVLPMSVAENTTLPNVGQLARWGTLDRATERRIAETQVGPPAHQDPDGRCSRWSISRAATSRRSCSPSGSR